MVSFSRLAVAATLIVSFGGIARAQSQLPHSQVARDQYYALSEGSSGIVTRPIAASGVVPPSESDTVMGLRVPR